VNDTVAMLEELGVTLPTPAYVAGVLLFSIVGLVAYIKGRRRPNRAVKWLGIALMLYPYVIWDTLPLFAVGIALSGVAWWAWRSSPAGTPRPGGAKP
jgi:hypothetical protein